MLIIFVALIVGPIFAGKFLNNLPKIPMDLMQPTGKDNNDTTNEETGTRSADPVASATDAPIDIGFRLLRRL